MSTSEPLRDSAVGHPPGLWTPRFQPRSSPREGGRMPWFFFASLSTQLQGRADSPQQYVQGHDMRFKRVLPPSQFHQNEGKRIGTSALLHVVQNGSEVSKRSNNGRVTLPGVVEGLGIGKNCRFGRPGQHKSSRCVKSFLGRGKENRHLDFPSSPFAMPGTMTIAYS